MLKPLCNNMFKHLGPHNVTLRQQLPLINIQMWPCAYFKHLISRQVAVPLSCHITRWFVPVIYSSHFGSYADTRQHMTYIIIYVTSTTMDRKSLGVGSKSWQCRNDLQSMIPLFTVRDNSARFVNKSDQETSCTGMNNCTPALYSNIVLKYCIQILDIQHCT